MAVTTSARRLNAFLAFLTERFPVQFLFLRGEGRSSTDLQAPVSAMYPKLDGEQMFDLTNLRTSIFSAAVLNAADRILLNREADVILCDHGMGGVYGTLLARWHKTPFIYSSHNMQWRESLEKDTKGIRRLPLSAYHYAVERAAVKSADTFITTSAEDAEWCRRWRGDRKTLVIPQGVDQRDFFPQARVDANGSPRVLFCGNYGNPFNLEAVEAVARHVVPGVLKVYPDTIFEFVGANPPLKSPHPSIVFTGYSDDYPKKLRRCDAVVVPLLHGYGFHTKIVEALACGRPTVSTPVGAQGLTGTPPRHLTVTDIENFAPALLHALGRSWDVNRGAAEAVISRYSWDSVLAPLEGTIYLLCGRRTPV